MTGTGGIPAFAGMTWVSAGMTVGGCRMTGTGGDSRLRGNDGEGRNRR